MLVDLEIDNLQHNKYAVGKFNMYFLNEKSQDLTPKMYGNRLPKDVGGLQISIKENSRNAPQYPEHDNSRRIKSHYIRGKYLTEEAVMSNQPKEDRKWSGQKSPTSSLECSLAFTRAVIKVASSKERGITVQIKRSDEDFFRDCFENPSVHMSQKVYTVLASYSGTGKNNWHVIHSVIFNDLEQEIKSDVKHDKFSS